MSKKIVIKNIISSLLTQLIRLIYGLIVPILIIRTYGSNVNGLVNSITQFLSYIALLEGGIGPVIKNALYKPLVENNKTEIENILGVSDNFFKKIAFIFIFYLLILCLIYPYFVSNNFEYIFTISLILIISISNFLEYFVDIKYKLFLQSDQKNFVIDNLNTICYILNLILIIVLVFLKMDIRMIKIAGSLVFVIKPIFLIKYFKKHYCLKINHASDYKLQKKWDGLSHHIAATIQSNADIVILTILSTLTNVSIYSVYNLIINSVRTIILSFTNGIDAFFGKLMASDSKKFNDKFSRYSFIFYTITTILLSCTLFLIIPFVKVYTADITDAIYIQPLFAYILVLAEFNYVIRYPFSTLVYAKGLFKETRNFSIIEPFINLLISIILVKKYGLVGVVIGTLISMLIRSWGFILFAIKNILNEKIWSEIKVIIISYLEIIVSLIISLFIQKYLLVVENYLEWLILAIIVFIVVSLIILTLNILLFRNSLKSFWKERK